jgi:myo-inositol-1(or 4)-monophosphatase
MRLNAAVRERIAALVRTVGRSVRDGLDAPMDVRAKRPNDFVTNWDQRVHEAVIAALGETVPDVPVLSEEGERRPASERFFLLDPIDGTTNLTHRHPNFAVSLAYCEGGKALAGWVYDVLRDELFEASEGAGVSLNGRPVHVSGVGRLADALAAVGSPVDKAEVPRAAALATRVQAVTQDIRISGSAALDLAYVAAGRVDLYAELYVHPWDVAAGARLVEEAGGRVTTLDGNPLPLDRPSTILASNGRLHEAALAVARGEG